MNAPSMALSTAIQSRRVGSPSGRASASAVTELDLGFDGHAGADAAMQRVVGLEHDLHRDALHHLGEVSGGVVRWQQAELRAGSGEQAIDAAVDRRVGEGVEVRRAFCPSRMRPTWVSLKLAWTQMSSSGTSDSKWVPTCTYWPLRALRWPTRPLIGEWIRVRDRLISACASSVRALAICASRRLISAPGCRAGRVVPRGRRGPWPVASEPHGCRR